MEIDCPLTVAATPGGPINGFAGGGGAMGGGGGIGGRFCIGATFGAAGGAPPAGACADTRDDIRAVEPSIKATATDHEELRRVKTEVLLSHCRECADYHLSMIA